jgi:cytochrome c oxidase cbb3-type subunit 3
MGNGSGEGANTIRRFLRLASCLLVLAATAVAHSQTPVKPAPSRQTAPASGHQLFEASCAACHGLDGRGGEHAPDIVGAPSTKSQSDAELFRIIHDGIVAKGMPSFLSLGDQKICAMVRHLRSLQGASAAAVASGDPQNGRLVFHGKGSCADCHAMKGAGNFVSTDLSDFAATHSVSEIRDAILHPAPTDGPGPTSIIVTTIAGDRYAGRIRNESNSSLQIQDAQGRYYVLAKSTLRTSERSAAPAMPANDQQRLSRKEIDDLVGYIVHESAISKLAGAPSTTGGSNPGAEEGPAKYSAESSIGTNH